MLKLKSSEGTQPAPSAKRQRAPPEATRVGGPMAVAGVFREAMNGAVAAVAAALDADASLLERPQVEWRQRIDVCHSATSQRG